VAKKRFKRFWRRLVSISALYFSLFLVKLLPLDSIYRISKFLAKIVYLVAGRHRCVAEEGLKIAFGDTIGSKQIKTIILGCFEESIKGALETLVCCQCPAKIKEQISIKGSEYLEQALTRGKGAICVSAHFGNFPLLMVRLQFAGFPCAIILRPMRDENIDRFLLKKIKFFGLESIYTKPAKACVDKALSFLKKNGIFSLQLDQNFGSGRGVFVDFFGKQAATATGPVVMALRSKAAIMPVFIIRKEDNTQEIIIEPEFVIEKKENFDETVKVNIAKLTKIIENYIRRYPAQWSWIHRRWKSRPASGEGH